MTKYKLIWIFLFAFTFLANAQSDLEERIGKMSYEEFKRSEGFYDNEKLLGLIEKVGRKLEEALPKQEYEFKYFLIDTQEPNAMASSAGYIFVTRGLMSIIDTEDELAGILGHEFTHMVEKHAPKKLKRNIFSVLLKLPGNTLGLFYPQMVKKLVNAPVHFSTNIAGAAFDRRQENKADEGGIDLAIKAGYNPYGLKTALEKLQYFVDEMTHSHERFNIFMDHPLTSERVEDIDEMLAEKLYTEDLQMPIYEYLEGMLIGQDPAKGVFTNENEFLHPELDMYIKFPSKWKMQNTQTALYGMSSNEHASITFGIESDIHLDTAIAQFMTEIEKLEIEVSNKKNGEQNGLEFIHMDMQREDHGVGFVRWIHLEELKLTVQSVATAPDYTELRKVEGIVGSLQKLPVQFKNRIGAKYLHISVGRNESLKELALRLGVENNLRLMEIFNSIGQDENVEGKFVKYIRDEVFHR